MDSTQHTIDHWNILEECLQQTALMQLVDTTLNNKVHVVILPENAAGAWWSATQRLWQPIFEKARQQQTILLIGTAKMDAGQAQEGFLLLDKTWQFSPRANPFP